VNVPVIGTIEIPRLGTLTAAARDAYLASLGIAAAAQDESRKAIDSLTGRTRETFGALVRGGAGFQARGAAALSRRADALVERLGETPTQA
jgi:hypothetical protein